jgi:hypothetical protein
MSDAVTVVGEELQVAQRRFPPFASAHEGLAVVREEYLEFERAVFHGTGDEAWREAIHLAAMAARYVADIGTRGRNPETRT